MLSVRSFLLPRRRRASTGLRSRWSVMEPAALLVLVCCQPQPPASSSSSLSKLLPPSWQWMHAAAGLQGPRPACSTSLETRSTGTLQASSAQRIPSPRSGAFRKMGCCSRGPRCAFPWSWRPPRSSTGKTKVVGLDELSMPAPLYHAYHDGIPSFPLALCDPPTGGTYVYVGPVGGSPPGAGRSTRRPRPQRQQERCPARLPY